MLRALSPSPNIVKTFECLRNFLCSSTISDSGSYFSLHIVFAILEVLQYDFPGVYSMIARPEFYAYIQYPGYR